MKTNCIAATAGLLAALAGPFALADNPDNPKFSYGNDSGMTQRHEMSGRAQTIRTPEASAETAVLTAPASMARGRPAKLPYLSLSTQEGRDYRAN